MTTRALGLRPSYAPSCVLVPRFVGVESGLTDQLLHVARFVSAGATMPTGAIPITPIVGFALRRTPLPLIPSLARLRAVLIDVFVKSNVALIATVLTLLIATPAPSF
jgi:hypothetical protein